MSPFAADLVRKSVAYALAIALSILLLRVLSRLAEGTLSAGDPAIYASAAIVGVGVLWIRAAKRVRRGGSGDDEPPPAVP